MRFLVFLTVLALVLLGAPATAQDLGNARLQIAGARLSVAPESQTVPFDTPTVVNTVLEGFDVALGTLPEGLRVVADFSGPEISGLLTLETVPNEPFRIPRLSLEGEYVLDNIRLIDGGELLAYAEPRSAAVLVTQVLVASVSSRPLTLDEIRSYGIVVNDDSFQAFNFTFGFAVDGSSAVEYSYNVPIAFDRLTGQPIILHDPVTGSPQGGGSASQRFKPPQLAPFTLEIQRPAEPGLAFGGCEDLFGDCRSHVEVPLPGVILFPNDISLLNQFFSVVLVAGNGAPEGDPLVIRDLTARVTLPPGLRMAETEPRTPLGVPIPVRVPGPDGRLGTADDLNFLIAQASGEAEVLIEGLTEGNHLVRFDLAGTLEGLPEGPRLLIGTARGAVLVRDPTLGITVTHPDVVRVDEEYSLLLTVTNTALAPANLVKISLPPAGLSGVQIVGGQSSQTIAQLAPGEAEVVEFRLKSLLTGRVIATAARVGGGVTPTFELTVGVGENDIPLSPTSIILPASTEVLDPLLVRRALGLIGLGFSLATAPPSLVQGALPEVGRVTVDDRVHQLAQAGRHVVLGEDRFDSLAQLAVEWTGGRDGDWEWDLLRRTTQRGAEMGASLAGVLATEAAATSQAAAFARFAATTAFLPPIVAVLAEGGGARLEVASRTSGKTASGSSLDPGRTRDLPFADLFDLGGAEMALMAVVETEGYDARLRISGGGSGDLTLLVPTVGGTSRLVRWSNISLSATGEATVSFRSDDSTFVLNIDSDGDGQVDSQPTGQVSSVAPRLFTVVAARQSAEVDPSGHVVEVLFSADVDLASLTPVAASRFELPDNLSNGGFTGVELAIVLAAQNGSAVRGSRVVRVLFNNPVSPLVAHNLTVRDVDALNGQSIASQVVPVVTTLTAPGGKVTGTVVGADGNPVAFAEVALIETDICPYCSVLCQQHRTAAVIADGSGYFEFDYVRQTECSDLFEIEARDPATGYFTSARARMRFVGSSTVVDLLMLGRGTLRGQLLFDDGTVPTVAEVVAYSPVFGEGRRAVIDASGNYELREVPVGTVTLSANDGQGHFVFATVELESAGAVTTRDLILLRSSPAPTGEVRGFIVDAGSSQPVFDAFVALYVEDNLVGVLRSGADGFFDFGTVPAGTAEIQAFDGETALSGGNVFFEILADQVNQITLPITDDRGTVEGFVYRRAGTTLTPLVGAPVWIAGTPFHTLTDQNGAYSIEGVYSGDRRVFAADLATGERVSDVVTVPAPDLNNLPGSVVRTLYFDLPASEGGIAGQVLNFDGLPVVGATVHLAAGSQSWFREISTDLTGRFALEELGPGSYSVHAFQGANGGTATASIDFAGDTPFVTIQFKKGTIRGVVKADDGTGQLIGVQSTLIYRTTVVRLGLVDLDVIERQLTTETDGTFELPGVLAGRYELRAFNPFYEDPPLVKGTLTQNGELIEHELVFGTPGTVTGVVYRPDGVTPAVGARLDLRHPAFASYTVTSDTDGRFRFELVPPQSRWIHVDAQLSDGVIFRQARASVQLNRAGQEVALELTLPAQGSVTGRLKDANGNDVPSALVTLRESGYPGRSLNASTDATGQFAFTNVFAGELSLSADAPTLGGLGAQATATLTTEGQVVSVVLTLEAVGEIIGDVRSPVGNILVAGTEVTLRQGARFIDRTTSDADGAFSFRLLPLATYSVEVFDPTTGRQGREAGLAVAGNNQVVASSVLLEARGVVTGTVSDPDTALGVAGATVTLRTSSLIPLTTYSSAGADGMFLFEGIPQGSFTLTTQEAGGLRKASGSGAIAVEDEVVTVNLVLEATGSITGEIRNPPGMVAGLFANANARIVQNGTVIGATLDNPYRFDNVIVGRPYTILVDELGGSHRTEATGTLTNAAGLETLHLTMAAIGSAKVSVFDTNGNPVSGVDVRLVNNSTIYGHQEFFGETGANHEVIFNQVGAGTVGSTVTTTTGLKGSQFGALLVEEGEQAQVTVTLTPSGSFFGRALLSDGVTPAAGASVVVRGTQGWTFTLFTDSEGRFDVPAVPVEPGNELTVEIQQHLGPGYWWQEGTLAENQVLDLGDLVFDDDDPYVMLVSPAAGTAGVATNPTVTVVMNEPLNAKWFSTPGQRWIVLVHDQLGTAVAGTRSLSADGLTMAITLDQPLASDTLYRIDVGTALFNLAGRNLAAQFNSTFRTADVVPPTLVMADPADGANEVSVSVQPRLLFSEQIDPATLAGGGLQLTDMTTGVAIATTFLVEPGDFAVVLTPVEGLAPAHQYSLTVQGVSDTSGNAIVTTSILFWTQDPVAPVIGATSPAPGTAFTSGQAVTLSATVSDNVGVAAVTFHFGGRTTVVQGAPYVAVLPAPTVSVAGNETVLVEATDAASNLSSLNWQVVVGPSEGDSPPVASFLACLSDGDLVLPGVARPISFQLDDDTALDRWELRLNGSVVDSGLFLNGETTFSGSYAWTPPLTGNPGDSFAFELQASDFTGNLAIESMTFDIASGTLLSGGGPLDIHAGADLVISSGTFTVDGPLQLASLAMLPGAILQPASGSTVDLTATGTLRVQCDAQIDLFELGFPGGAAGQPGGAPLGIAPALPIAGGSHGGAGVAYFDGAATASQAGEVYDSVYRPSLPGGGGARSATGNPVSWTARSGGGVIRLAAAEIVIGGDLRAAAGDGISWFSSGAGGSVFMVADVVRGGGQVDARGGNNEPPGCCGGPGGGGGGGRVAIRAATQLTFDPFTQIHAEGGRSKIGGSSGDRDYGGAGTIFLHGPGDLYGRLLIANGEQPEPYDVRDYTATELPALGADAIAQWAAAGSDGWLTGPSPFAPRWNGVWVVLLDPAGTELGAFRTAELDGLGRLRLEGAGVVASAATYRGEYRFDRLDLLHGGGLVASDPLFISEVVVAGDATQLPSLTADTVTVLSGASVYAVGGLLDWRVSGQVVVEAGGAIDLTATGYLGGISTSQTGGAPAGVQGSPVDAGGSHGGLGAGYWNPTSFGEVFDSVYQPELGGGGGSLDITNTLCSLESQPGGGVLHIEAAGLTVDGELLSRGGEGLICRAASGAGGTVLIEVGTLDGTGTIDVSGGDAIAHLPNSAGIGGGGRISILADQLGSFDPLTQAISSGGLKLLRDLPPVIAIGGAGTVYWKTATDSFGHLKVAQTSTLVPPSTPLPALGSGAVGTVSVDALDPNALWIEPQDPAHLFALGVVGMWVRVDETDFRVIDQTPDRRSILLAGATGAVATADGFRGLYKFDTVYVQGGATLELPDPAVVGDYQVDGTSTVVQPPADPPLFGAVTPAEGAALSGGYPFTVTAEVSDVDGVDGVTLTFAGQSYTDTAAPYEWQLVAPVVSVATVQAIVLDATDSFGETATLTRTVTLQPVSDPLAPVVTLGACPAPGDLFVPGGAVPISFTASDSVALYRYSVRVNGTLLDSQLVAGLPVVAPALVWASPASASAGSGWTVEVEVEDVGGNVTTRSLLLSAASGTLLLGDQTLSTARNGEALVLGPGVFTIDPALGASGLTPASLVMTAGAVLESSQFALINTPGAITIQCGALIDLDGGGYAGGQTPGNSIVLATGSQPDAGGSHGGAGSAWLGTGPAGEEFGSVYLPVYQGGGGSAVGVGSVGGKGGGQINLQAGGPIVVDGRLSARGEQVKLAGSGDSSGAGGAILLHAPSVSGSGFIDASGGDYRADTAFAGSGGGGRVGIWSEDYSGIDPLAQIAARGGARLHADGTLAGYAAAGTLHLRSSRGLFDGVKGELIVDQGAEDGATVVTTRLMEIAPGTIGTLTASWFPNGLVVEASDPAYLFPNGLQAHWLRVEGADYLLLGTAGQRKELTVLNSAGLIAVGDQFEGIYPFDKVTVRGGASLEIPNLTDVGVWVIEPGSSVTVLDSENPTIASPLPAPGTSLSSGQLFTVSGNFADNIAVAEAVVDFGGYTFRSNTAPFSVTVAAPVVQVAGDHSLTLSISDFAGNVVSQTWTLQVQPVVDVTPPSVALTACPAPGDIFAPGGEVRVNFTASDDLGLYRYTLLADGVEVDSRPALGDTAATLTWLAPAGLVGGVASTLVVEVEDVGGNTATASLSLTAASGTVLVGDQTIETVAPGQHLVLGPGHFEVASNLLYAFFAPASLTLTQGARLTDDLILTVSASEFIRVQCGASVELDGRGYAGGVTPGISAPMSTFPFPDSGGSFGGRGSTWNGPGPASEEYGSVYVPGRTGGGGSAVGPWATGGAGGGSIRLWAFTGSVVIDGTLSVRGEQVHEVGQGDGSGAGGTISIFGDVVSGSGLLDASGGDYRAGPILAGSGGGGRVSIWANDLSQVGALDVRARGGARITEDDSVAGYAAAGTLVLRGSADPFGPVKAELIIDQGGSGIAPVVATRLPFVGSGVIGEISPLTSINGVNISPADPNSLFASGMEGCWIRVEGSDYITGGVTLDRRSLALYNSVGLVAVGDSYQGIYPFSKVTVRGGAQLEIQDPIEADQWLIEPGSSVTPPPQ